MQNRCNRLSSKYLEMVHSLKKNERVMHVHGESQSSPPRKRLHRMVDETNGQLPVVRSHWLMGR